jgi:Plavaka transposase
MYFPLLHIIVHSKILQMQHSPLSFGTAKELHSRIELLPSGPQWFSERILTPGYPTKRPVTLYYRDALDCLESLFSNPIFNDHMDFAPYKLYKSADKLERIYSEWMTGDSPWEMQVLHAFFLFLLFYLIDVV